MENENVVNDMQQTVVESANESVNNCGNDSGTPEVVTNEAVAEPIQTKAENAGFRKLRLQNESYKKEIEELREKLSGMEAYEDLKKQNEVYLERLVSGKMQADLKKIQSLDANVKDLSSLGEDFIRLIENGIDAKVAYKAVKQATDGNDVPPPSMGAVTGGEGDPSRFYSSKELDRLTPQDLDNPKIFNKAMESLKRL